MSVPRVMIASVFAPGTLDWLPMQRWFLDQTTEVYRLFAASPDEPPPVSFQGAQRSREWVPWKPRPRVGSCCQHASGLKACLDRFCAQEYDLGLILDSDAFPVRRRWAAEVLALLATKGKQFAAPVRVENSDLFPHVSFLAFLPEALPEISSLLNPAHGPGLWKSWWDTGARLPLAKCLPLLRSNVFSPSPVLHSIYGDIAYHRGAGSRGFNMRGWKHYWRDVAPRLHDPQCQAVAITPAWINRLLGERRFAEGPVCGPGMNEPFFQPLSGDFAMPNMKRPGAPRPKPAKPSIDQVIQNVRLDLIRAHTRIFKNPWGYTSEELLTKLGDQRAGVESALTAVAATPAQPITLAPGKPATAK